MISSNNLLWSTFCNDGCIVLILVCSQEQAARLPRSQPRPRLWRWGTNMATATPSWQTRTEGPRKLWRSEDPTPPPHWRSQVNLAEAQLRRPWRQSVAMPSSFSQKKGFSVSCPTNLMSFSLFYLHLGFLLPRTSKQCYFIFSFAFYNYEWYLSYFYIKIIKQKQIINLGFM